MSKNDKTANSDPDIILIQNLQPPPIMISDDEEDESYILLANSTNLIQIPEFDPTKYEHLIKNELLDLPTLHTEDIQGFTVSYIDENDSSPKITLPLEEITLEELEAAPTEKKIKKKPCIKINQKFKHDYRCDICDKVLGSKIAVKNHKVVHITGKQIFECNLCLRSYSVARVTYCYFCVNSKQKIFYHAKKLSNPNKQQKEEAPFQLARNQYEHDDKIEPIPVSKKPLRCYLGAKKHSCNLCEARFPTVDKLEAHQILHIKKEEIKIEPTSINLF